MSCGILSRPHFNPTILCTVKITSFKLHTAHHVLEGMTFSEPHVAWQVLVQQNSKHCFNTNTVAHPYVFRAADLSDPQRNLMVYYTVNSKTLCFSDCLFLISVPSHLFIYFFRKYFFVRDLIVWFKLWKTIISKNNYPKVKYLKLESFWKCSFTINHTFITFWSIICYCFLKSLYYINGTNLLHDYIYIDLSLSPLSLYRLLILFYDPNSNFPMRFRAITQSWPTYQIL